MTTSTRAKPALPVKEASKPQRPSRALIAERGEWSSRRSEMQERLAANARELEEVATTLASARREAVRGEERPDVIAGHIGHQRALEAERDELQPRIELALAEEQTFQRRIQDAMAIEQREDLVARAVALVAEAAASDRALIEVVVAIRVLLRARRAIDVEILAARQRDPAAVNGLLGDVEFTVQRLEGAVKAADPEDGPRSFIRI